MTDRARFEPALISINVGDTVEWRNVSRHPHTVTVDPNLAGNPAHVVLPQGAQPINSGEIPPGQRFTHTFRTPGIYYYVCLPHEDRGMVGIVVVNPGPGGGGQQPPGSGQPPAPQGTRSY
jgi:plastocyanin